MSSAWPSRTCSRTWRPAAVSGSNPACSFAYRGPGTGTSPLPIFFGYFQGAGDNANAASYTSANFRSNTFLTPLARFYPNPYAAVDALDADANSRTRAIAAGLTSNLILANPDLLGGANIVENETNTMFNSMVLELRRRVSSGLAFQTSYVFGHATQSQFLSLRIDSPMIRNGGAEGDVTHAFKANVVYELPFGQGRRFGSNAGGVLNGIIGGWQLAGNARVQSGQLVDFGNVRLVGMTKKEFEGLFKLRKDAQNSVWMLPQEIIDESVKAFSASATSPTGYGTLGPPSGRYIAPPDSVDCIETIRGEGACGLQSLVATGPMFKQFDVSIVKRFDLFARHERGVPRRRAERVQQRELRSGGWHDVGQRHGDHQQPTGRQRSRRVRGDRPYRHEHRPGHPARRTVPVLVRSLSGLGDSGLGARKHQFSSPESRAPTRGPSQPDRFDTHPSLDLHST